MPRALSRIAARLLRWNFLRTADVFAIGYPKTGNTWLRFLLGQYLMLASGSDTLVLFDGGDRLGRCQKAPLGPAMHFTHEPLTWDTQTATDLNPRTVVCPFLDRQIILIVRHPLDTLVSAWWQARLRAERRYEGELTDFLADPVFGLEKLLAFYNIWAEHGPPHERLSLIRYEDLRADTPATLLRLLAFLHVPLIEPTFSNAIRNSSFEAMQALEHNGADIRYNSSGLSIFATADRANPEAFHLRRGKVGGYRDYLQGADCEYYQGQIRQRLHPFYGYAEAEPGQAVARPAT